MPYIFILVWRIFLVNLKKDNALSTYYGSADFQGCPGCSDVDGCEDNELVTSDDNITVKRAVIKKMKNGELSIVVPTAKDDESHFYIEPVLGIALKGATVIGIYSLSRTGPMYTPDMTPTMVPYYSTYEVMSATKEQLDELSSIFVGIPEAIALFESIFSCTGVVLTLLAVFIIIRTFRRKTDNERKVTPKGIVP